MSETVVNQEYTSTSYRLIDSVRLKPLYISLGIPKTTFTPTSSVSRPPFRTALAGSPAHPDCVWFIRTEDALRLNLSTGKLEEGPVFLSKIWSNWPALFQAGIDAATWAGPKFQTIAYFFKETQFLRINLSTNAVDTAPQPITQAFGSSRGTFFAQGCDCILHDMTIAGAGVLHVFRGDQYLAHNLKNGALANGPIPIIKQFALPAPFASRIDVAFYGAGEEAECIYFFSSEQYVLLDPRTNTVVRSGAITDRFPVLAEFMPRPQLFLVEDYNLNLYVANPVPAHEVGTVSVGPGEKTTVTVVFETTEVKSSEYTQSLVSSQTNNELSAFYNQMSSNNQQGGSTDNYAYGLDASFHGDASANSLWGGDVNANLAAKGHTDDVRSDFSKAAANTLSNQVNQSSSEIKTSMQTGTDHVEKDDHFLSSSTTVIDNSTGSKAKNTYYMTLAEPYMALLSLTGERIAYADGDGVDVEEIPAMDRVLNARIPDAAIRQQIRDMIVAELSSIPDVNGVPRSAITTASGSDGAKLYSFDSSLSTTYAIKQSDGSTETVSAAGLIKGVQSGLQQKTDTIMQDAPS